MTESPNHIVQEAESIVNAANVPSANSVDPSAPEHALPARSSLPCGCNGRGDILPVRRRCPTKSSSTTWPICSRCSPTPRASRSSTRSWGTTAASQTSPRSSAPREAQCRMAAHVKAGPSREIPARRQKRHLLAFRQPRLHHARPGHDAHLRIIRNRPNSGLT